MTLLTYDTTYIIYILNVTPDSFFGASRAGQRDDIARRVGAALEAGASVIDVGGCSTRPGAAEVSPEEEWRRVAPALEVVRKEFPQAVVSIDTFRARVARQALENFGPCIINDVSGAQPDPAILDVAAEHRVPYVLTHSHAMRHADVVEEIKAWFAERLAFLRARGIAEVILDPGFGFAKTVEQNFEILRRLDELIRPDAPMMVGLSRKSMIYKTLGTTPEESLAGTVALNWEALRHGAKLLRVHDPREAADIVKLHNFYNRL